MGITVGGEKAWRVRRKGDIVISYQWINEEPCMLLFPANPGAGAGVYAVALSSAWKYADSQTGGPSAYLFQQADVACEVLGLLATRDALRAVADAIVDGLPDLVDMPPEPNAFQPLPKGEMKLQLGGDTVAHVGNA